MGAKPKRGPISFSIDIKFYADHKYVTNGMTNLKFFEWAIFEV